MPKRILCIGNCSYDVHLLAAALKKNFEIEMREAETAVEASQAVSHGEFDLIMVNRLFDSTGESGIELIKKMKPIVKTPMMLISNYLNLKPKP